MTRKLSRRSGAVGDEARIVEAISQLSPRETTLISGQTGIKSSKIRYVIRNRFRLLGLRIHTQIDLSRIGLVPIWAEMRFTPRFANRIDDVFRLLNQFAYLVYFGRLLPIGDFVVQFAVPRGLMQSHRSLLERLERMGVVELLSVAEVSNSRSNSMNPRFFDFGRGGYEVDWDAVRETKGSALQTGQPRVEAEFDLYDLLVMKELQLDCLRSSQEIAKRLNLSSQEVKYHLTAHVERRRLISGYTVRWAHDIETSVFHSVVIPVLTTRENNLSALRQLQVAVSKIPFLNE